MQKLSELTTEAQLRDFADQLIGEGRECEKCLFMAIGLFLNNHCDPSERTFFHMAKLVSQSSNKRNVTKVNQREYAYTDFENLMHEFSAQYPNEKITYYFSAFMLYPQNTSTIASGNLLYRLIPLM